jgi:hypothetical protein
VRQKHEIPPIGDLCADGSLPLKIVAYGGGCERRPGEDRRFQE